MSKSSKLYSDSPALKRGEDGSVGIERPSEATQEDIGTSGNPLPGTPGQMPIDVHEKMQDMVERHAAELKDLHKRHEKEHSKVMPAEGDGKKLEGTPAKKIEKDK